MKLREYMITEKENPAISPAAKRGINRDISKLLKPTFFKRIPLQDLFNILKKYGIVALQEDNIEWSGLLLGGVDKTEQVYFDLGWINTRDEEGRYRVIPNARLAMSYFKMPSGRYEIIAYVG